MTVVNGPKHSVMGRDDRYRHCPWSDRGGALITHFFFGSIFLVNVPIALVASWRSRSWCRSPRSPSAIHPTWWTGVGTAGIRRLILAIIQGPSWVGVRHRRWCSSEQRCCCSADSPITSWPRRTALERADLQQPDLLRQRRAMATNFFCLFGFIFLVTQYFQLVRGYSALSRAFTLCLRLYGHVPHRLGPSPRCVSGRASWSHWDCW